MASPKAIRFENEMLELVATIKSQILTYVEEGSDARQAMQQAVNELYERAHRESRSLRKALAFLHTKLEALEKWAVKEHQLDVADFYEELDRERK